MEGYLRMTKHNARAIDLVCRLALRRLADELAAATNGAQRKRVLDTERRVRRLQNQC